MVVEGYYASITNTFTMNGERKYSHLIIRSREDKYGDGNLSVVRTQATVIDATDKLDSRQSLWAEKGCGTLPLLEGR